MTHESESIDPVSELELAALCSAAVPGMQVREIRGTLKQTDSGQWLRVVDANGTHWLVWAPSSPVEQVTMSRHEAVLAVLQQAESQGAIPWSAPQIVGSVRRVGGGVAIVMEYPGGSAITDADLDEGGLLPASLGAALAALHELPAQPYKEASRRYADSDTTRKALRGLIDKHKDAIPSRLRSRWTDALAEDSLWSFQPVPLHGDLSADHVYASQGAVVGLTRFDHAAVGDPAADLVWLMYYASDQFLSTFEESYARARTSTDLHLLTRAQLLSEVETLRWYSRGFAADDRRWREQGVAALRDLDWDIGDQRLVPHRPEVVEITFGVEDEPLLKLQGGGYSGSGARVDRDQVSGSGSLNWDTGGSAMGDDSARTTDVLSPHSLETGPYSPFGSDDDADTSVAHAPNALDADTPDDPDVYDPDAHPWRTHTPEAGATPGTHTPDDRNVYDPYTPDFDDDSPHEANNTYRNEQTFGSTPEPSDSEVARTEQRQSDSQATPTEQPAPKREYVRPIRRGRTSSFEVP